MPVDLWMSYMLMLVSMTLTLMHKGHSGSAKAKNQRCMLSVTKQAIIIKLATMSVCGIEHVCLVGHFYMTLTLALQTFIWLVQLVKDL